ncbi:MAG TPA: hypothetical protein VFX49_11445 [Chloroflexota bacterium]|nr:hypothetical protein [Chloroflexota bacterium]
MRVAPIDSEEGSVRRLRCQVAARTGRALTPLHREHEVSRWGDGVEQVDGECNASEGVNLFETPRGGNY